MEEKEEEEGEEEKKEQLTWTRKMDRPCRMMIPANLRGPPELAGRVWRDRMVGLSESISLFSSSCVSSSPRNMGCSSSSRSLFGLFLDGSTAAISTS
jgi:hypothetical protein